MKKSSDGMDRTRNGSLYDCGAADSYYGRRRNPHYWPDRTFSGERVHDLTPEQIAEYNQGFDDNTARGDFKDWG